MPKSIPLSATLTTLKTPLNRKFCVFFLSISLFFISCNKSILIRSSPESAIPADGKLAADFGVSYGSYTSLAERTNINLGSDADRVSDNNYLITKKIGSEAVRLFINLTRKPGFYNNYVSEAAKVSKSIVLALTSTELISPDSLNYKIKDVLVHFKKLSSKIVYVEINEYDLFVPAISDAKFYNDFYKPLYTAVNEVNTMNLKGGPLQIGGPCTSNWNPGKIQSFIKNYAADSDQGKRLDFIAFHEYTSYTNGITGGTKVGELTELGSRKTDIDSWLTANKLGAHLPIFVTEHGIFPGDKVREKGSSYNFGSNTDNGAWLLMQAASAATLNYYYINTGEGRIKPFIWVARFGGKPEKSILVPNIAAPVKTPFGNLIEALKLMDTIRVKAISSLIDPVTGYGVYGLATIGTNRVNLLVWNWQHTSAKSLTAAITFNNLPATFAGKKIRFTSQLIDANHANYFRDIANAPLKPTILNNNLNTSNPYNLTLQPNALALLTLTVAN